MFNSLKAVFTGFTTVPFTFTISSTQCITKTTTPKTNKKVVKSGYKIADRQKWSDNEYYLLLQHSFLGQSRGQLQTILGREPGKIFSKLQKHQKTVDKTLGILEKALRASKAKEWVTVD